VQSTYAIQISATHIAGLDVELDFDNADQYLIALLVFFVTYFVFKMPSNVIVQCVASVNWLTFSCLSWGLVGFWAGFAKK
jgi:hypothetical protein